MTADLDGKVKLTLGTGQFIKHEDWLIAIPKVPGGPPQPGKGDNGYIKDFFSGNVTFNGTVDAEVSVLPPFERTGTTSKGTIENFKLDLLKIAQTDPEKPEVKKAMIEPIFDLVVDLPGIGGLKNLEFEHITLLMNKLVKILIGEKSVEECEGGLLGEETFLKPIPGTYCKIILCVVR